MGFGYSLFSFAVSAASLGFGLVYPAFSTIQAIETPDEADNAHWLNYWLIYSLITIAESLFWPVLQWVPLYAVGKAAFLAWLVLPQTKGALWVFEHLLGPGIVRARRELDNIPQARQFLEHHHIKIGKAGVKKAPRTSKPY